MSPISVHAFRELLDRLGPDLDHWPTDLAQSARQLLAADPAAASALAQTQCLATALATLPQAPLPAGLAARIVRSHPAHRRTRWGAVMESLRQFWSALGGTRMAGPVLAAGLLLGGLAPYWTATDESTAADPDDEWLVAAQLDDTWSAADLEIEP